MGSVIIVIVVLFLAIVGIDKLLIAISIGVVAGIVIAIVETVQNKKLKGSKGNKKVKKQLNKTSRNNEDDEVVIDLNLMKMVKHKTKDKSNKECFDWETHCESCGELLEDCECDWRGQSKQDISQDMDDLEFDEMLDYWDELDEDK